MSIGSYPFIRDGLSGSNIVVRSIDPEAVRAAVAALCDAFPDAVA